LRLSYQIVFNWIVFFLYVILIVLIVQGKIKFGHGLGDLFYLIFISLTGLIQLIINLTIANPKKNGFKKKNFIIGIVFMIILILFGMKFTVGRGPEMKWNGKVFVELNKINHKLSTTPDKEEIT